MRDPLAMKPTVYEKNYTKLIRILGRPETWPEAMKLTAPGFMDLEFDLMERCENGNIMIAISHYGKQNGDSMADPDMMLMVYPDRNMVEALSFQNDYIRVYRTVYTDLNRTRFDPKEKISQNSFLGLWLGNIIKQGHTKKR